MCNVIWFGLQKSQSEQRNNVQHSTLNTRSNLPSNVQCLMACLMAGLPWDTDITISSRVGTHDNSDSSNSWGESCSGGFSDCSVESSALSFSDQSEKNTSGPVRVTYGIISVLWCTVQFSLTTTWTHTFWNSWHIFHPPFWINELRHDGHEQTYVSLVLLSPSEPSQVWSSPIETAISDSSRVQLELLQLCSEVWYGSWKEIWQFCLLMCHPLSILSLVWRFAQPFMLAHSMLDGRASQEYAEWHFCDRIGWNQLM